MRKTTQKRKLIFKHYVNVFNQRNTGLIKFQYSLEVYSFLNYVKRLR